MPLVDGERRAPHGLDGCRLPRHLRLLGAQDGVAPRPVPEDGAHLRPIQAAQQGLRARRRLAQDAVADGLALQAEAVAHGLQLLHVAHRVPSVMRMSAALRRRAGLTSQIRVLRPLVVSPLTRM